MWLIYNLKKNVIRSNFSTNFILNSKLSAQCRARPVQHSVARRDVHFPGDGGPALAMCHRRASRPHPSSRIGGRDTRRVRHSASPPHTHAHTLLSLHTPGAFRGRARHVVNPPIRPLFSGEWEGERRGIVCARGGRARGMCVARSCREKKRENIYTHIYTHTHACRRFCVCAGVLYFRESATKVGPGSAHVCASSSSSREMRPRYWGFLGEREMAERERADPVPERVLWALLVWCACEPYS